MINLFHLHRERISKESSCLLYGLEGINSMGLIPLMNHLFHRLWADQHIILVGTFG